jgi:dTDP-4-dehydrorhamnose reductase
MSSKSRSTGDAFRRRETLFRSLREKTSKPRILLTGRNGQIGRELQGVLAETTELKALGHEELNLAETESVREAIRAFKPHLVLNAAGYTAVDKAESEEPLAHKINAEAPAAMAEEAKKIGAALVHYSTDYVFDGARNQPYTEQDATNPLSAYGRTKLAGETAIEQAGGRYAIFRTEWVYATRGKNFLLTVLRLASEREELRIVCDQIGAPTWSRAIAEATAKIVLGEWRRARAELFADRTGIYHMTAAGQTSWHDFAVAIVERARQCPDGAGWLGRMIEERPLKARRILPIATKDHPAPARRPAYSVLSNARLQETFGVKLADWRIQLETALGPQGLE